MLVLGAVGLTAAGFLIGRRLSPPETEPGDASAPAAAAPALPAGDDAGTAARATADAGSDPAAPGAASAPQLPQGLVPPPGPRSAGAARGRKAGARGIPAVPPPAPAPRETDTAPGPFPPQNPAGHGFAAGLTRIGGTRPSEASLKGFEPAAVTVKRAPRSEGSIEFEVTPSQLSAGQPYVVKIYLRNHGEKPIQVKSLTIASELNGHSSRSSLSPRSTQVAPSLVGLLAELPGVWKGDVSSWSLEADVLTSAGDTYSNRVAWK